MKNAIDPRTTRRTVSYSKWARNSALFSTFEVLSVQRDNFTGKPVDVVLQRKPEFCRQGVQA
ncbi:MAG: hypothetical protein ACSLE8_06155 [Rhodococcus sp. (in: high G+C Gram-positive bacteria)]